MMSQIAIVTIHKNKWYPLWMIMIGSKSIVETSKLLQGMVYLWMDFQQVEINEQFPNQGSLGLLNTSQN